MSKRRFLCVGSPIPGKNLIRCLSIDVPRVSGELGVTGGDLSLHLLWIGFEFHGSGG
jgi:hypothetical protein